MRHLCRAPAFAIALWGATAVSMPEAAAQRAPTSRYGCALKPGGSVSAACPHVGFVAARRSRADIYIRQSASASRALWYPPRIVPDIYLRQSARPSRALPYPRHASPWQSRVPAALHMTQIPRPFRIGVPQPYPLYITRPCYTRFADPLGCPTYTRWQADPFVEALIQSPDPRTIPLLRALGLPIIPDVPPIVIINPD